VRPDAGTQPDTGPVTLSVLMAGVGRGSILSSAGPLTCSAGRCSQRVPRGLVVTLTAVPEAGSRLSGWSGACAGTGICELTADGPREVTARINLLGYWSTALGAVAMGVAVADNGDAVLFATSSGGTQVGSMEVPRGAFLARFSEDGEVRWVTPFPGLVSVFGEGSNTLTANPDGTLVLTGTFRDSADLGSGTLRSVGETDLFVAGFTSDGRPLWSKRFGGTGLDSGLALASRGPGFVAVTGQLGTPADFDSVPVDLGEAGHGAFVLQLSTDGAVQAVTGLPSFVVRCIAANARGDVWVAGRTGSMFGSLLQRLSGGRVVWTRDLFQPVESEPFAPGGMPNGLAVDADGTATLVGHFNSAIDFGQGPIPTNGGKAGFFVARYGDDSALQWARVYRPASDAHASSVAVDGSGNLSLAGWASTGLVDLGGGVLPGGVADERAAFLGRLSPDGNHRYSQAFSQSNGFTGAQFISTQWVASNAEGATVVVGSFYGGAVDFGDAIRPATESRAFLLRFPPQ
jgi:hypothetical protein